MYSLADGVSSIAAGFYVLGWFGGREGSHRLSRALEIQKPDSQLVKSNIAAFFIDVQVWNSFEKNVNDSWFPSLFLWCFSTGSPERHIFELLGLGPPGISSRDCDERMLMEPVP